MDYFDMYRIVLSTIASDRPADGYELIQALEKQKPIHDELVRIGNNKQAMRDLSTDTMDTLENLIDDGLVMGRATQTKDGKLFMIERLSSAGRQYLAELVKPDAKRRLKSVLKSEGIPLTFTGITKAIAMMMP